MRRTDHEQPQKKWLEPFSIILAALIVATALFISRADDEQPRREIVTVSGLLPAGVPFTPAVRAGGLLFLSGQVGIRPGTFQLVDGGIEAEARQTNIADWAAFNEVYSEYFPGDLPARSAFAASGLVLGAAAEVDCIAADPDDD